MYKAGMELFKLIKMTNTMQNIEADAEDRKNAELEGAQIEGDLQVDAEEGLGLASQPTINPMSAGFNIDNFRKALFEPDEVQLFGMMVASDAHNK